MPQMYCSLRGLLYSPYSPRVFGRSHVRRQMPPRHPTTREILVAKGGTMWARINRKFCLRLRLPRQFRDLLHAANLPFRRKAFWGFFRPEKSWRLRPGWNPRTWVLKASTLPLDHRSRLLLPILTSWSNIDVKSQRFSVVQLTILFVSSAPIHAWHVWKTKKKTKKGAWFEASTTV